MRRPARVVSATPRATLVSTDEQPTSRGGQDWSRDQVVLEPNRRRRLLATVAFTLFLDLAGFGMILPVLPYFAEAMGASETEVAILATAFSLAQFAAGPFLGRLSDRHGRRPIMLVSIAGSIASGIVLGFAGSLIVVFLARIVAGLSKANISTAHAAVADVTAPDERAKYMGMMGAALGMGFVFGPAIGGVLSAQFGPTMPFFGSAGLAVINWLMAFRWMPETIHFGRERADRSASSIPRGVAGLWRHLVGTSLGLVIAINFVGYFAFSSMESTFALYNERQFDWGPKETGYMLTFAGVVIAITQGGLVGRVVRALGEVGTLALGLVVIASGLLAMGFLDQIAAALGISSLLAPDGSIVPQVLAVALFGSFCFACGNGLLSPTVSSLVSQLSRQQDLGWNMGLRESGSALARITAPLLAGPLFQFVGPGVPMAAGGGLCVVALALVLVLRRKIAS